MSIRQEILNLLYHMEQSYFSSFPGIKTNTFRNLMPEDLKLYRLKENPEIDGGKRIQAQEMILTSLKDEPILFFYMICTNYGEVEHYYGIVPDLTLSPNMAERHVENANEILKSILKIGWVSQNLTPLKHDEKRKVIHKLRRYKYAAYLEGVPGVASNQNGKPYSDEIVKGMGEDDYGLIYLGKPLNNLDIADLDDKFGKTQNMISSLGGRSIVSQRGCSNSSTLQVSTSNANTNSNSQTVTKGISFLDFTDDAIATKKEIESFLPPSFLNRYPGFTFADSPSLLADLEEASMVARESGDENNVTFKGVTKSEAETLTNSKTNTSNRQVGNNSGKTRTRTCIVTRLEQNKSIKDWENYLTDVLRRRASYSKGMSGYLTNVILLTNNRSIQKKLETLLRFLYCGENGVKIPSRIWSVESNKLILESIYQLQIPNYIRINEDEQLIFPFSEGEQIARSAFSQLVSSGQALGGYFISCKEFGQMTASPHK